MSKSDNTQRYLGGFVKVSAAIFLILAVSKLLTYGYRVIIARYFGAEQYGLFSLALMIVGWAIAIFAFGLSDGLTRFAAFYRGKNKLETVSYLFSKTRKILLISGLVGGIILFVLSDIIALNLFHDIRISMFLKIMSITVPLTIYMGPYLAMLLAFEKPVWHSFVVNVWQNLVFIGVLLIFMAFGVKSYSIAISYLLGVLGATLASTIFFMKLVKLEPVKKNKESDKAFDELVSYSWPRMFLGIVSSLFFWIDSFVLGYFAGVKDVGYYNVAVPIAVLLGFAPEILMRPFFPIINKEYAKGNLKSIREMSKQVGKWVLFANLPLLAILLIFPGAVIGVLFGPEYFVAANALRILAIGAFSYSIGLISMNLISMKGDSRRVLYTFLIAFVCNAILNFTLIPLYGLVGAAIATTLSYLILSGLFFMHSNKELQIVPLKKDALKVLLSAAIASFALWAFAKYFRPISIPALIVSGIGFLILYVLILLVTKAFDNNDKSIFNSIISKARGMPKFLPKISLNRDST